MNIQINENTRLTTERSESSYGIPVLVVDATAYGRDDAGLMPALIEERLQREPEATRVLMRNLMEMETLASHLLVEAKLNGVAETDLTAILRWADGV